MFGKIENQKCSECGREYNVELGMAVVYQDKNGVFHCEGEKCECGHILNSERINNAEKIGVAFY